MASAAPTLPEDTATTARSELGAKPRALLDGIRDTFGFPGDDGARSAGPGRDDPHRRM